MKYSDDFRYREMPTDENLSQYPTILDILEDIAEEEEIGCVTIDPILRNVITGMIRRGHFIVSKEKDAAKVDLLPTGKKIDILYRGQSRLNTHTSQNHLPHLQYLSNSLNLNYFRWQKSCNSMSHLPHPKLPKTHAKGFAERL